MERGGDSPAFPPPLGFKWCPISAANPSVTVLWTGHSADDYPAELEATMGLRKPRREKPLCPRLLQKSVQYKRRVEE